MAEAKKKKKGKKGWGGSRPGSGRPRGARDKDRLYFEERAAELNISPIELISNSAQQAYAAAHADGKIDAELLDLSVKWTALILPYVCRKMPIGVEVRHDEERQRFREDLAKLSQNDLEALFSFYDKLGLGADGLGANGSSGKSNGSDILLLEYKPEVSNAA